MDTVQWWYNENGEEKGPVTVKQLQELYLSGRVGSDCLVWKEGMDDWVPLSDPAISNTILLVEPNEKRPPSLENPRVDRSPHPWRRLFARWIDMILITMIAPLVMPRLGVFLMLLIWIPIEGILLARWGYTPGKWLFGIRVRDSLGKKVSFDAGVHRAFLVWLKGIALGLPLINLVTMGFAYRHLTKYGATSWDQDLALVVSTEEIPLTKKIVAVAFFALFLGIMGTAVYFIVTAMHG